MFKRLNKFYINKKIELTPSLIYSSHLKSQSLTEDFEQSKLLNLLDNFSDQLNNHFKLSSMPILHFFFKKKIKLQGLYLWGGVGIGKTFLMDCFFDSLLTKKKRRIHFHSFMQDIHLKLQSYSGYPNPLNLIAKLLKKEIDILFLDEFFVSDIVDAMILAALLDALLKEGIFFFTTSNIPPHLLYKNGLRRDNFLPAIDLLEKKLHIFHLNSKKDYRLHYLKKAGVYYTPLNQESEQAMEKAFQLYVHNDISTQAYLLCDRLLPIVKRSQHAIWFDFYVLCGKGRFKQDYLSLIEDYSIIFLSHVPILSHRSLDEGLRFIQLVDILYDSKTRLIISAEVPCKNLYEKGKLFFEFQRTISRLVEMQSQDYVNLN